MVASISGISSAQPLNTSDKKQEILENLIRLAKQEQEKGNSSITPDKLDKLSSLLNKNQQPQQEQPREYSKYKKLPLVPKPKYPSIYKKFNLNKEESKKQKKRATPPRKYPRNTNSKFSLKKIERFIVEILENLANILDNLHLLSNLPMFPKFLLKLLKQTNKIWVLILVFLIRKTISQLLNVVRKIQKVEIEYSLLNKQAEKTSSMIHEDICKKYNKVLKDLKFDKVMLIIELIGNFLDLSFNLIELYGIVLPDWVMGGLNFASMAMTIYRMNKDDEYVDDDITEDLI